MLITNQNVLFLKFSHMDLSVTDNLLQFRHVLLLKSKNKIEFYYPNQLSACLHFNCTHFLWCKNVFNLFCARTFLALFILKHQGDFNFYVLRHSLLIHTCRANNVPGIASDFIFSPASCVCLPLCNPRGLATGHGAFAERIQDVPPETNSMID